MVKFKEGCIWQNFSLVVLVLVNFPLNNLHFALTSFFLTRTGLMWRRTARKFEILFILGVVIVMRCNPARNMRAVCLRTCFMHDVASLNLLLRQSDPVIEVVLTPVCFGGVELLGDLKTWNLIIVLPVFDPKLIANHAAEPLCNLVLIVPWF